MAVIRTSNMSTSLESCLASIRFLVLPASLQTDTTQSRNDQDSEEDLVTPAVEAQIFPGKVKENFALFL